MSPWCGECQYKQLTFVECLLCARCWAQHTVCVIVVSHFCLAGVNSQLYLSLSPDPTTIPLCQETHVLCYAVTQSCPTLCHPMDCGLPGSSVHGLSWL